MCTCRGTLVICRGIGGDLVCASPIGAAAVQAGGAPHNPHALGVPSSLLISRVAVHPAHIQGHCPHHEHPGMPSTPCVSWGSIHTADTRGHCHMLWGPGQTASRPPFLKRSGDLGVRLGAGWISIKVKVSQSRQLLTFILFHF